MPDALGRGRPSSYTEETAAEICESLAEGVPLREICRREGMPKWRTIYDWIEARPDFAARFTRAREVGFDAIAAECLEIADDATNDYMERRSAEDPDGVSKLDTEHIQRSKLRVETRLKLLAKWSPQKYGDKIQTEHSGSLEVVSKDQRDAAVRAAMKADE